MKTLFKNQVLNSLYLKMIEIFARNLIRKTVERKKLIRNVERGKTNIRRKEVEGRRFFRKKVEGDFAIKREGRRQTHSRGEFSFFI